MRPRSGSVRSALLSTLAFAGVMGSHEIAYRLAAPDHHDRTELLVSTGHRYFGHLVAAALALLVFSLALFLRRAIAAEPTRDRFGFAVARLLPAQVGLFLMLEVGERAVLGDGIGGLYAEPAVLIGFAIQVLLALLGALVLLGVGKVARILRALSSLPPHRSTSPQRHFPDPPALLSCIAEGGAAPRAPPAS